jgi:hypothetical protein
MIGLEELHREAFEVLMSDRNSAKASEPTQEGQPRSLEARVSTHLIAAVGMESQFPAPDFLSCIGAYMRASL